MPAKRFLPAVLLLLCLGLGSVPTLAEDKEKKTDKAQDFSGEAYVFEQFRTVVRFESDGTFRRELSARVRVQSEAGVQRLGQLIFGYSSANEQMEMGYVRVRKSDGTVVAASASEVQDLPSPLAREAPVYSDFREKHITVPGLRPGEVLEYDIVTRLDRPLMSGQFYLEYGFEKRVIVLDEELEINVPRGREIKLKTQPGFEPKISEEGDRRIYRWTSSNRKRESDDDDKQKKEKKKKKSKKNELPDVQLTTLHGWDEVGRWYWELQKDRVAPTEAVRAKAQELVRGKTTDLEKIEALYDFVATNFRYISLSFGVGRYQPHAAGEILGNRYGDCKDKHTLLAALLESVGLHASPVLINATREIDPDVPAPSQFNHVITAVRLGKDYVWMDTTTEVAPFRLLAPSLRHKQALLISPDGSSRLAETPANPPFPGWQRLEIEAKVNELGKLEAQVQQTVRGDNEIALRAAFRRVASSQWKELVQALTLFYGLPGKVSEVKASDPADTKQAFHFEYQVAESNYLDWSSKKSQPSLFLPGLGLQEVDADSAESDSEPFQLLPAQEIVMRLKMELPAKYSARLPVPVTVTRDYGEYRSSYKMEGKAVVAERVLLLKVSELPGSRARDYTAFRRAVQADGEQKLSVESTSASTPAIPETAKADDLFEAGVAALRSRNADLAIQLFQRVVALEPKHKYAWNNLGRAFMGLQKYDDAIHAFQKQVEVNPYDEWVYNNLAFAYWRQQKYEPAAEFFRKQLEVNPLDEFAHGNLGLMYCEWRKYSEAVPELEKAISLKPDNAIYQVGLGRAYLNLNQTDKAVAAFDKAVELSPAPGTWNDVAYELSLHKVALERAQQYAESALASTSAALRNVSLDRLRNEDLPLVFGLAAYWDTLGWVRFQQGNLGEAEKYIYASWQLAQHGEVGDHLAQIYEKQGEKEKAIRTYALALAATRPVPETREHLAALVGEKNVEATVNRYRGELAQERTIHFGLLLDEDAEADFFILLPPGGKVEAVKFIRGSGKLRPFTTALMTASYPAAFPDSTPTKIVRRGTLSCAKASRSCDLVLVTPDNVNSVN